MTSALLGLVSATGPYALLLVVGVAFCETGLLLGFLLPGDTLVFGTGLLIAGGVVHLAVWPSVLAVAVAATAGDQVGYLVGRRAGPWLAGRRRGLSARHLEHAAAFFERHGARAVVLARFVPLVRTMTPVVAGLGGMPRHRFVPCNALGAGAWAVLTLGGGYWFGAIPLVAHHLTLVALVVAVVSLAPVVVPLGAAAVVRRIRREPSGARSGTPTTRTAKTQEPPTWTSGSRPTLGGHRPWRADA